MSHDVFISHSTKDKPTADAVCAMLESSGIRCWIAPRDVTPGMEWGECIIDAIEECRIMVLVFTMNANDSPQIRREVERAVNHGVAILPVRIEDVLPGRALEFFIGNVHWLDALTPPLESHLRNLADTVKILLARMPPHNTPGVATPEVASPIPPPEPLGVPSPPPMPKMAEPAQPPAMEPQPPERPPEAPPKQTSLDPPWPPQTGPQKSAPPVIPPAASAFSSLPPPPPPPDVYPRAMRQGTASRPLEMTVIAIVDFALIPLLLYFQLQYIARYSQRLDGWMGLGVDGLALAAGYGLIRVKNWGRILQIILAAISVAALFNFVSMVGSHSHIYVPYLRGAWFVYPIGGSYWQAAFIWLAYYSWVAWSLFTPKANRALGGFGDASSTIPSEFGSAQVGQRPVGVTVVAGVGFIFAAFLVFGFVHDSLNSFDLEEISVPVLACAICAASYGLLQLKAWGRILEIIVCAVGIVVLLVFVTDAFSEINFATVMWIFLFIYSGAVIWFMFTPGVKQAFKGVK